MAATILPLASGIRGLMVYLGDDVEISESAEKAMLEAGYIALKAKSLTSFKVVPLPVVYEINAPMIDAASRAAIEVVLEYSSGGPHPRTLFGDKVARIMAAERRAVSSKP